jgi:phosphatidylethanolamine-binding protein (PEBP) family uncharacterized protein
MMRSARRPRKARAVQRNIDLSAGFATIEAIAFQQNGHIPSKYTCEGEDVSPPLAWEGVPNGAKSLVLIIEILLQRIVFPSLRSP